jgi:Tfp pilus assembly protein PilO
MSSALEQLQLTPQERRIVVAIGLVVIVVLNVLFVWPHFGEWGKTQKQLEQTYRTIESYNKEIALDIDPTNGFKKQLAKLEKLERQEGAARPVESEVALQTTIKRVADSNGVRVDKFIPVASRGKTDDFFEEQAEQITILSQEPQLINFLYQIGNDPSMIRVSSLTLQPDNAVNRYKFNGTITLTANYAKRPVVAAKPAAKPPPPIKLTPGNKPAANPNPNPGGPPLPTHKPAAAPRTIPNPTSPPGSNPLRRNL